MGIKLEEYQMNRLLVVKHLTELEKALSDMILKSEKQMIHESIKDMLNDTFQLVVVGEFSRGKSTFINALLGEKILPSSPRPTTTVLNKIVYSSEPFIKLYFHSQNKPVEMITEEQFEKLVAPMEPIQGDIESEKEYEEEVKYVKSVQYAEIGRNLSICENGVEIIDTPGTNDLDPIREQITNTIIPRSDAAILLLSATKILSESELSLLRDRLLANDIQKIFIVINFKDQLNSMEDQDKVMEFAYQNLKDILLEPKIYIVTAKHALNARRIENGEVLPARRGRPVKVWDFKDTGFDELERHLTDFLQNERGSIKLLKPLKRSREIISMVKKKNIDFERNALNVKTENLKEEVAAFRPKVEGAKRNGHRALKEITQDLQLEEKEMIKWYEERIAEIAEKAIETFEENSHLNDAEISSKVETAVAKLEKSIFIEKKQKMTHIAKISIQSFSKEINQEWVRLENELNNIGHPIEEISLVPMSIYQNKDEIEDFFISIYQELNAAWSENKGFWEKTGLGIGYIANTFAYGITSLVKWGWTALMGPDEKAGYRKGLLDHYNSSSKKKINILRNEYKNMVSTVQKQYKLLVEQQITQMGIQLDQLQKIKEMKNDEISLRHEIIDSREKRLNNIDEGLKGLARKIEQKSIKKAGVL